MTAIKLPFFLLALLVAFPGVVFGDDTIDLEDIDEKSMTFADAIKSGAATASDICKNYYDDLKPLKIICKESGKKCSKQFGKFSKKSKEAAIEAKEYCCDEYADGCRSNKMSKRGKGIQRRRNRFTQRKRRRMRRNMKGKGKGKEQKDPLKEGFFGFLHEYESSKLSECFLEESGICEENMIDIEALISMHKTGSRIYIEDQIKKCAEDYDDDYMECTHENFMDLYKCVLGNCFDSQFDEVRQLFTSSIATNLEMAKQKEDLKQEIKDRKKKEKEERKKAKKAEKENKKAEKKAKKEKDKKAKKEEKEKNRADKKANKEKSKRGKNRN